MQHRRKFNLGLAVLVTFLLGSLQAAHAQTTFTFDFTSSAGFDATGILLATSNNDGSYTASSGNITIPTNSSLLQAGTYNLLTVNSFAGNDNLVFPTASSVVDTNGLSFGTAGGYAVNLYESAPYFLSDTNNNGISGTLTVAAASVPEIAPVFGCGIGMTLGGLCLLRQRRLAH